MLSWFSFPFFLSLFHFLVFSWNLQSVHDIHASTKKCILNWILSIYWHSFLTPGHPNQKPFILHSQNNHKKSGHLNQNLRPRHTLKFGRTQFRFRQARQSLLFILREYSNAHPFPISNSCSLSQTGEKIFPQNEWHIKIFIFLFSAFSFILYLLSDKWDVGCVISNSPINSVHL